MTTVIKDLRGNSEHAARQWKRYKAAVDRIGDTDSLRAANEGLGFNLVLTIPGLLQWIEELTEVTAELRGDLAKARAKPEVEEAIPAEPMVPDVSESLELEVVTEELVHVQSSKESL